MVTGGRLNPDGDDGKGLMKPTQSSVMMTVHGRGKSKDVAMSDNIRGTTDGEGADGS